MKIYKFNDIRIDETQKDKQWKNNKEEE